MKSHLLTFLFTMLIANLFSQEFVVPTNYEMETTDDFKMFEPKVIECVTWLVESSSNDSLQKRTDAKAFLIKWLLGNPTINVEMNPRILTFINSSPDLLLIFMGGWVSYSLKSQDNNNVSGSIAGIETVIEFYQKNKRYINEDKNIEVYIKMKKEGKLESFIRDNI